MKQMLGPRKRILHSGKWKRIFGKLLTLCLFKTFFCWWSPLLKLSVNRFLRLLQLLTLEEVFPVSGKGFFYLLFLCFWKPLLTLIFVSTSKWGISLKNTVPIDRKKISLVGVSEKWRKKWFPVAEKSVVH